MSPLIFENGAIVTPHGTIDRGSLLVEDGRVAAMNPTGGEWRHVERVDLRGGYLLPGFIDTQVNGGGGVLFNSHTTADGIAAIGAAHAAFGTTAFLPTLISDDLEVVDSAMRAVESAIEQGIPGVLGIHLEGPFLATTRKGIHDSTKFRRIDADAVRLLSSLRHGRALITVAPEQVSAEDIATLVANGVIVAAGHTDADYPTMRRALDAGITGFTHLFNAMSPFGHRQPGVAGAALEDQTSYCGIIVDGVHVDPAALRIALRARPKDRFMLATDAMPTVGSASDTFMLGDQPIVARGLACYGQDGTLAGSNLDMATALANAVTLLGVTVAEASFMAAGAPARFLGVQKDRGSIEVGKRADFAWLDHDLRLMGTWSAGLRHTSPDVPIAKAEHRRRKQGS